MKRAAALTLGVAVLLGGCTAVQTAQLAVARYCALPEAARAANREAVALALAPNAMRIDCAEVR